MLGEPSEASVSLSQLLPDKNQQKIPALPLEFEYFPVEVISKEFTKLNSPHPFRVHYLGPRPLNTLALHKRYSCGQREGEGGGQYRVSLKRIINCNFTNERLLQNNHYRSAIFYRAFEGMNPTLPLAQEFLFNSAFESGNLDCVIKVRHNEFDLFLRIDSNTRGHTAWYYFSVRNGSRKETLTLNICNLTKPNALYPQGMRPFVLSRRSQRGWEQEGDNCRFEEAGLRYALEYEGGRAPTTYRLSFEYSFQFEEDEVFFAYCVPYTYSQLQQDLQQYARSPFAKRESLGQSLTGVELPVLHVTNPLSRQRKKNVVITARVHPAEANSSHMLRGFIAHLLGESREAEELRNSGNYFIVPMLNPDGVILGNSRTSAAGKDLNREFMSAKKELYPEVLLVKQFTARLQRRHGVFMYLDFHGHSRRKNTFLYGPNYPLSHAHYYKCRLLPRLIEKTDPRFRFYSCSFAIPEHKKTTARAVMLHQLKIQYVYTIESSAGLYFHPTAMRTMPFSSEQWQEMGSSIATGINSFVQSYLDFEAYIQERKDQRLRLKEQKEQKGLPRGHKSREDELEVGGKARRGPLFLEMLEEVRAADQLKCFEEDAESDDHDEMEDLEGYKLSEFNNMVTKGIQRQRQHCKAKEEEIDFEAFAFPEQPEEEELLEARPSPLESPPKRPLQAVKHPRAEEVRRREKASTQVTSVLRLREGEGRRGAGGECRSRTIDSQRERSSKNFVLKNKERYSLATKNLFPLEDKCEILSLPRNIQVMRKSMKKGRLLINHLEEGRLKFHSAGGGGEGNVSKCSLGVAAESVNLNDFRIRKSQSHFHELDYGALQGLETDNRAMTITAFKQRK